MLIKLKQLNYLLLFLTDIFVKLIKIRIGPISLVGKEIKGKKGKEIKDKEI